jgi:hypothetical protein
VSGPSVEAQAAVAVQLIDEALRKPPAEAREEVDVAERAVVVLRDRLIDELRAGADRRALLDRVNAALSLIAGVEYPVAKFQRRPLEQARDLLLGLGA